jgi:hypothetical protein
MADGSAAGSGTADQPSGRPDDRELEMQGHDDDCAKVDGVREDEAVAFGQAEFEHTGLLLPVLCALWLCATVCKQTGQADYDVFSLFEQALPPPALVLGALSVFVGSVGRSRVSPAF